METIRRDRFCEVVYLLSHRGSDESVTSVASTCVDWKRIRKRRVMAMVVASYFILCVFCSVAWAWLLHQRLVYQRLSPRAEVCGDCGS